MFWSQQPTVPASGRNYLLHIQTHSPPAVNFVSRSFPLGVGTLMVTFRFDFEYKFDYKSWQEFVNLFSDQISLVVLLLTEIKRRRWTWIRHVIIMPSDAIPKIALRWTPNAGRRRWGKPNETWRRTVEREMKENGLSWAQVEHLARNRGNWQSLVLALCATGHEED